MENLPTLTLCRQLMLKTLGQGDIALPFGRDIFLIETHVAGLLYHDVDRAMDRLASGVPLRLRREPENGHDDLAIMVLTGEGDKLGSVPKVRNPVLARLMDAGKTLVAEVAKVGEYPPPGGYGESRPEIRLRIALRE